MGIKDKIYIDFINGSISAFERIYNNEFHGIRNYIGKIIKIDNIAEELAQDVFVKFWESRENIDLNKNVDAYLTTLAKNAAFNYIRHKAVEQKYVENEKYTADFISADLENTYHAEELGLFIKMLVSEMPEQRRKVFIMSREDGLSNEEIATKLGISIKTVYRHLELALDYFRKMIMIFLLSLALCNMI